MPTIYHVAGNGSDANAGLAQSPFRTIGAAALAARAGDTVTVHEGIYREWVKPKEGGFSDTRRITYQAAAGEKVVIKGSEQVTDWERVEGSIWKTVLDNGIFGNWNPYREIVAGDWMIYPQGRRVHLGDVYLNGKSFYEAQDYDALRDPQIRRKVLDHWTQEVVPVEDPEQTKYLWFAETDDRHTTIYANFHAADPRRECVEVHVRKCCFYPERPGVNYLTVRGFEMAHAAVPWAPPTGDQPGLLGTNWSKGWIIEGNHIHDAKCSAVSIGKEASTGDNRRTFRRDKPGYQYQLEAVFSALKIGWSKEKIGSHIIRHNEIHDCGQNGVVGHLGCVFSEIYGNHIHHIALKREFYGHEIAGIKLHAAIDVQIRHNFIHDCSLGTWLDWQAQGTRVSKNLYLRNNRDLFVEVSHGPYLVDHNIFTAGYALDNHAQGGAYVNNLFAGKIVLRKMLNRATPYHAPHSTEVAGYAMVYGADDRLFGNLFIGGQIREMVGTAGYDGCTSSLDEYMRAVDAVDRYGDLEAFEKVEQPAYLADNAYFNGAKAFAGEREKVDLPEFDAQFWIEEGSDGIYLNIRLPEECLDGCAVPDTLSLGRVRIADADFENPDGSPVALDTDYTDQAVGARTVAGPVAGLRPGANRVKLW
ncbi:MAG: right-handed parallel beta-helix repeat-containing protein [Clostridium sp.]|jgi:hypothetical protein|nr:right-handed parallel beta-helix repeat-containing protein [Clostridium sp.]